MAGRVGEEREGRLARQCMKMTEQAIPTFLLHQTKRVWKRRGLALAGIRTYKGFSLDSPGPV